MQIFKELFHFIRLKNQSNLKAMKNRYFFEQILIAILNTLPYRARFSPVLGYPGCRFACPGLSARWAFSPLHLMGPIVPDFVTSNWTPYQLCSNLSRSDEPRGEPSLLGLSRGENASRRKLMNACKIKLHRKQEF